MSLVNKMGSPQYVHLEVCESGGGGCDSLSDNVTNYSKPIRVSNSDCAPVTAKMAETPTSKPYVDFKAKDVFPCK
ncbi:hypothetical protein RB200_18985 [Streptomyces sp. PmtG]